VQYREFMDEINILFDGFCKNLTEKLDVISREEFDVQKQVLAKARLQLNELETLLTNLTTSKLQDSNTGSV